MEKALLFFILGLCFPFADAGGQSVVSPSPPHPMRFTENRGQWDARILFRSQLPGGNILLEKNNFYFFLYSADDVSHIHHPGRSEKLMIHGHAFKEEFIGANPNPVMNGEEAYPDYANYYLGNNPKYWASGARIYSQVRYEELYKGIDLVVYTAEDKPLKYDFMVKAGADVSKVKIHYEGVDGLQITDNQLRIKTSVGDVIEQQPYAYQEINGFKKEVKCLFHSKEQDVSFDFPEGYDKKYPLVIDPNIIFSSYTGSIADNWGYTATYDNQGNMYVGGYVNASSSFNTGYPVTIGAFQTFWAGGTGGNSGSGNGIAYSCDMGITKFSANGTSLIYSTYLGGRDNETPNSLVVDAQDNLIIYGVTYSTDYPVTANAYSTANKGGADLVVTKFNAAGTALIGSTYIGGASDDGINFDPLEQNPGNLKRNYGDQNRGEVNIDASDNIYVASCTKSFDFPTTAGALQATFGGTQDGCVFKLNSDCSQLVWGTYLGGSDDDACYSLNIGPGGTLYVAGGTMSRNFPTTNGTLHPNFQGGLFDGFVALINTNGTQLLASSYIGTAGDDQVYFVKLDDENNVYFVGQSTGQYPVKNATYSNANSGQFIAKVNPLLTSVFYSTVFGNSNGQPNISPTAFLVDTCQNVYVAGWGCAANSVFANWFGFTPNIITNMPITPDALQKNTDGNDFYFFVLAKNAKSILYGSYFGGRGNGVNRGIEHVDGGTSRFDKRGIIYEAICAGCGGDTLLTPSTPGVWSPTNKSDNCNELGLKIAFNLAGTRVAVNAFPRATGCVPLTVNFQGVFSNVEYIHWYFGDGASDTAANPVHTYIDTGTYKVMLVGIDSNSCNIVDTAYLNVWVRNDSISANFLPSVIVDCDSNKVSLSAAGLATTHYLWDMGDNSFYSTQSVSHIYQAAGNYTITLIIADTSKCNLKDTFTNQVKIPANLHAGYTTSPARGCIPFLANFSVPFLPAASYHWSFGDGDTANTSAPFHVFTTVDTFQVQLIVTDTTSCNAIDTAYGTIITIDSSAHADFNLDRKFYKCDSVFVTVWSTYQGEDSQFWDFGDGTQVPNADSASHMYNKAGSYTITHYLTDSRMICNPIDTAQLVISLFPLQVSVTVADTGGCLPFTADFKGNSALLSTDFYWFFGDGDSTDGHIVSHTYKRTGAFTVKVIAVDTNSCAGLDSSFAQITVISDSVHAGFQLNILNDCDSNLVVNLGNQSTNALQYIWRFGDDSLSFVGDANHSYHLPSTYIITLVAIDTNRCYPMDSVSKPVTLLPNTFVDFTDTDICLGKMVQFNNQSNPAASFVWDFGDTHSSNQFSPSYLYKKAGQYSVSLIIIDPSTCNVRDTAVHELNVFEQPIAGFLINSDTFKFETPVQFTENSLFYSHLFWNFGDGTTATDENTPIHIYEKIGLMNVCIVASNDACEDTMCKNLFITFTKLIGVPNAFSPNGDGINDIITVEGKGIVEITFRIYNRWGEKVFETHDTKEGWNGIYKGVLQEMDVYTYTVEATLINGETVPLKGNITLLR